MDTSGIGGGVVIPVERVTELLAEHRWRAIEWRCACGSPVAMEGWAAHVAGVLADAGLIPTQREWGVRWNEGRNGEYERITDCEDEHDAKALAKTIIAAEATLVERGHRVSTAQRAHVVTRGQTDWEATNE